MQMYRVRYVRKLTETTVEQGDCVVCAANGDAARDMAAVVIGFAVSTAEFEVERVKPSLHMISRRERANSIATVRAESVSVAKACAATFPGTTEARESRLEEPWFEVHATANIRGEDENDAIRKLARGITLEMLGEKQKTSIRDLDIKCDRSAFRPRPSRIEENGLYTHLRFFHGGDQRGKG
jgi:hypothetical protein